MQANCVSLLFVVLNSRNSAYYESWLQIMPFSAHVYFRIIHLYLAKYVYLCHLDKILDTMTTGNIIRFVCILLLWLGLCWLLLTRAARIDFMVIFTIVASGIIVFVPLYKKYVRKKD